MSADGVRAVVGATGNDKAAGNAGAAYVFERDSGTGEWVHMAALYALDPVTSAEFGASVAIDGDRIAVGAHYPTAATTGGGGRSGIHIRPGRDDGGVVADDKGGVRGTGLIGQLW